MTDKPIGWIVLTEDGEKAKTGNYYGSNTTKLYRSEGQAKSAMKQSRHANTNYKIVPVFIREDMIDEEHMDD